MKFVWSLFRWRCQDWFSNVAKPWRCKCHPVLLSFTSCDIAYVWTVNSWADLVNCSYVIIGF